MTTRSYIPVDFVEDQSASDVVSDGEYFYVIEKYDETQKKAVVSRFPADSRSKTEPDQTYAFDAGVAEWSLGDAGIAYVRLENGKLLTLDTNSGRTLASVQYKGTPLPTLIGQNVLVVQHGGQISGVNKAPPSNASRISNLGVVKYLKQKVDLNGSTFGMPYRTLQCMIFVCHNL